jgi:hypothetical protein
MWLSTYNRNKESETASLSLKSSIGRVVKGVLEVCRVNNLAHIAMKTMLSAGTFNAYFSNFLATEVWGLINEDLCIRDRLH